MGILVYCWRNLWRNGRRTVITGSAVMAGTAALIFFNGFVRGVMGSAVHNATNLTVGEVQVHAPGYLSDSSMYESLRDPQGVLRAAADRGIAAAPRGYGFGLVARGTKSGGALFHGVDPALEREAFDLARHVAPGQGGYLPDAPRRGVVLGRKLARSLGAEVGAEVVVVVQAADGSLGNDVYTVTGILKSVNEAVDRSAAIVHRDDFEALFVSGGRIHEIAFNSRGRLPLAELAETIVEIAPGEEVRTWRELLPAISDMTRIMESFFWIFASIFFLAAGLGVMNTMLMATHERIREFGILKAIGATPWRIGRDIAIESFLLALVGTALGSLLGIGVTAWLGHVGIDTVRFAGETSLGGIAFDPVLRPAVSGGGVIASVAGLWATCVVASLYPSMLAGRLVPVEAMRRT